METQIVQVAIEHPAEKIFDIAPGTTMVDRLEVEEAPIVETAQYDDKDTEIDGQFQQVFNAAFVAYETQRQSTEGMNPQFVNRSLEVAAQFLNTALAAASAKSSMKQNKDKNVKTVQSTTNNTTNNLIMDRNEMLKMLMSQHKIQELEIVPDDQ